MKYKHVVITHPGGPDVLKMVEDELREPKAGEVRVKILATGVAFTDVMMREGVYPGVPELPYSPGYNIVGTIDKLGQEVSDFTLGQRVVALTIVGGYSEFLCIPAHDLVPVPESADSILAVSVVLHYLTAYQMLHRVARVEAEERILIHGAGGGVGTALLELGKLAGLEMYGTEAQAKHALVSQLGGIPIDYQSEDFGDRIRQLTTGGIDVVFDAIGGLNLWRSYRLLCQGGRLVNYGFLSAFKGSSNKMVAIGATLVQVGLLNLIPDTRKASFYSIASYKTKHPDWYREDLTILLNLLAGGQIKPVIADCLPLAEAIHAHELLDQGAVSGTLILICNQ
ncbi:zinc-binding dehydrogenase [Leptothermofonsia sichuanensis E412]|uniref:medium chain dehydrogenase/reductase family protein n=1 Tax=Leptothermofonsia sichuanensis TaxID=2917832 RepID=UPI001CA6D47D|nr:medium chain dehydrogenase/reductase family protein [Leptothermofonsia sichuanensis]QZZ21062.1 zinc-binding dehydrogenase [Leptothermofonsia sichuanensis E412]